MTRTVLKTARRLAIAVVLGWVGYVAIATTWTYYETQYAVDRALREAAAIYRTPLRSGAFTVGMLADVQGRVARDAERDDFPVRGAEVAVSATGTGFLATVHYDYPLITYRGREILTISLSLQRSLADGLGS
ncbi:MAG TPA: hypothetical protein VMS64_11410 [Candidatus Methylomirabilis sp.]|nr:hypothetical protein [Candidatus Methylomirabilis sp.]